MTWLGSSLRGGLYRLGCFAHLQRARCLGDTHFGYFEGVATSRRNSRSTVYAVYELAFTNRGFVHSDLEGLN
ncbi:MAG: hypothetical protein AAFO75_09550, partial [Pseudomonadota bacterium]